MADPFSIDDALVRKLAALLDETRLTEIEYAWGEHRVRVARAPAPVHATAPAPAPAPAPGSAPPAATSVEDELGNHPGAVKSPMVGTAYLAGSPGGPPLVKVGSVVSAGQPLLIIEAMKVMNQITAPKSGKVARILIGDASPVEFGELLMILE